MKEFKATLKILFYFFSNFEDKVINFKGKESYVYENKVIILQENKA